MSTSPRHSNENRVTAGDIALAGGLLLLAMLGTVAINKAWLLFSRPFWLDEYHTLFLANEPNISKLLQDLKLGADFNPPLLPVVLHAIGRLTGGLTPTIARVVSFACTWLSLLLVYLVVRPRRGPLVASGAALLLWTSPLTVSQAFQARFYAPWLLLTIAYAVALFGRSDSPPTRWRLAGTALLAVLLCNIHYFGIVSWGLLIVGLLPWVTRTTGAGRRFLASLAGPISLAAVVPMYLGQRAVLGSTTWIPPLSSAQVYELLTYLVAWPSVLGLMLLYLLVAGRPGGTDPGRSVVARWSSIEMALFLLLGLVAFLVVFSAVVQPVTVTRYAIPALLAWVPIAALVLHRVGTLLRVVALAGAWVFSVGIVAEQHREQAQFRDQLREDAAALSTLARTGLPLIAADRFSLYPLSSERDLSGVPLQLFELPDTGAVSLTSADVHERAAARAHARLFDFPRLTSLDAITQSDAFVLFASEPVSARRLDTWFPGYTRRVINSRIHELRRSVP